MRLGLSLRDNDWQRFQRRLIELDVPVELDARDHDNTWIVRAERNLLNRLILGDVGDELQCAYAPLPIPIPDCDASFRLRTDCDE